MNDGGKESGRGSVYDPKKGLASDDFGRSVARISVTQICENVGFQSFKQSALEAISDIMIRYLTDLGRTAKFYANLAGRTSCNAFDIVQGLEDLGSSQGFLGAPDVNHGLDSSGILLEIKHYIQLEEEVPFVRSVSHFPISRNQKMIPSFWKMKEMPPQGHIPDWLPAFPDPHTYIHTPVWSERGVDSQEDKKIEQVKQRRKAEKSLLNLHRRLSGNDTHGSSSMDNFTEKKAKLIANRNPFLAEPLQFGEKPVSQIDLPAKLSNGSATEKQISVVETFCPAIEEAKSGICNHIDGEGKLLPEKRQTVHFRFDMGKKIQDSLFRSRDENGTMVKLHPSFGKDKERDDKKKRVEQILREAMEKPHELPHL